MSLCEDNAVKQIMDHPKYRVATAGTLPCDPIARTQLIMNN